MRLSNCARWLSVACAFLVAGNLAAQSTATLRGRVTDENGGAALSGVQVVVINQTTGTQNGALTQADGRYIVVGLRAGGPYRVEARMIGYGLQARDGVTLTAGQTETIDFQLGTKAVPIDAMEVFATRAVERKTPVAYSDVNKVQIQNELGSQDLPMVLNVTPSVYATMQGGGAGDARINIRGFDQRHVGVMVDGVPVNDMENGWLYWSDFDGLADDAASIQVQRGFSAINLAVPSIGGTMDIITDPSSRRPGLSYKQEFGNDQFLKESFVVNTGEHDGFSFTGGYARKTGNGLFDTNGGLATWTNSYAFYVASAWQINSKNRLEFYAMNEPQSHGQNLYKLNIAQISHSFAQKLGYSSAALSAIKESGRLWSPNVNAVSSSYGGQQYASSGPESGTFSRHSAGYINERENYFDKPQVNLNYYSYFGNGLTWSTVAYYSGGAGGGSGTLGSLKWDYTYKQRVADWNATIAANRANTDGHSSGILRNSVNNQWTLGAISKLHKDYRSGWTSEVGLDVRTASIDHYQEVRDLLGGQYWVDTHDEFTGPRNTTFGDKISYYNTNTVKWLGAYVQGEKATSAGSFYGMVGWDQNAYTYDDHFHKGPGGGDLKLKSGNLHGYQIKGGLSRNFTDEWSGYANAGYVSKVPIFDGVIDDVNGVVTPNAKNETFSSFEAGMKYRALNRGLSFDLNLYDTTWRNHAHSFYVPNDNIYAQILGVDERHMGVELQGAYQPIHLLRFDVSASFGDWTYLNDASGRAVSGDRTTSTTYNYYIKGLKVSDQPQTQLAYAASLTPTSGLWLQLQGRSNYRYYAAFDPFGRTSESDHAQAWKTPGYTLFDVHATYRINSLIPAWNGGDVRLFANVFNLFNTMYVQDATDNSSYNAYYECSPNYKPCSADPGHNAEAAEVFLGLPRTYNLGFQVIF